VSGPARALRAVALGAVALALAVGAHVGAGGRMPPLLALLTSVVVLGCLSAVATGRRIGRPPLVVGLGATQLGLHLWFSATSLPGCGMAGTPLTGHVHAIASDCLTGVGAAPAGADAMSMATATTLASVLMLAAHALAVLVTGLLLAHGEDLLWRLAAELRHALPRFAGASTPVARRSGAPVVTLASPRGRSAVGRVLRRGPPVSLPAC
jgi:hypothetical protein